MIIPNLHEDRDSEGLVSRAVQEISSSGAAKSASARFSHLMARYLALRADDDEKTDAECHPQPNVDLCEKQSAASHIDIIVPVCIGYVLNMYCSLSSLLSFPCPHFPFPFPFRFVPSLPFFSFLCSPFFVSYPALPYPEFICFHVV